LPDSTAPISFLLPLDLSLCHNGIHNELGMKLELGAIAGVRPSLRFDGDQHSEACWGSIRHLYLWQLAARRELPKKGKKNSRQTDSRVHSASR